MAFAVDLVEMNSYSRFHHIDVSGLPDDARLLVSTRRYFSAHHMMIWAARSLLSSASTQQNALVVIAICAMAAEALANAVGQRLMSQWEDFDMLSPWGKFRLICRELGLPCTKGEGVWQDLYALLKLRNRVVHAKPELVLSELEMAVVDYKTGAWARNLAHSFPKSALEIKLTPDEASKAVHTIETVLQAICAGLERNDRAVIEGDIAEHGVAHARS